MAKELLDEYSISINDIIVQIRIDQSDDDFVPNYVSTIANISEMTKLILEKIREEFISSVNLGTVDFSESASSDIVKDQFKREVRVLLQKYFPNVDDRTQKMLMNYIVSQDLGLGDLEILLKDDGLEEIVVNSAKEPIWVYHRKYGWCKTNLLLQSEKQTRHYGTMIGRHVNKELTVLNPLMDAHLQTGDRVNATLSPISSFGNTLTIRKFAKDPWTISDFLRLGTISYDAAAMIWLAMQHELSVIVVGGTGSGKTSMLNVLSNFFPPNQRIISIEDTRELMLAQNLHWLAMETRMGNPEGKGEITMLNLLVNSLRQRPDRIVVGEVRRKEEAEILLEANHTGHSVYATFHANTAHEAVVRLTNAPISIPKPMLSAISLFLVQNRNRRTGARRTLQVAEILPDGSPNVLLQYDARVDKLQKANESKVLYDTINLFTGMTRQDIDKDLENKVQVLRWLVKNNIRNVDQLGLIFAKYYRGKLHI